MGWLRATYTINEVGWKIIGKLILITAISLIIGERLGVSNLDYIYRIICGIIVVLAVSGLWFFLTKIAPEQ